LARKTALVLPDNPGPVTTARPSWSAAEAAIYPDAWASSLKLKVDGNYFNTRGREYEQAIIRDESEWIVIPKGAQMGLTTTFLVRTFHWLVMRKWKHLYLMPLKMGAVPFVQGRIDPIMDSNPRLKNKFASVDNRLHKQTADKINLYIRGTNIWTELREIPVDVIVADERDKFNEENWPEAQARLDGSNIARIVELSTPTAPGHGVDAEDGWHDSDQHRWYVLCPRCGRSQSFTFEENVVLGDVAAECHLRCAYCRKEITDAERAALNGQGHWEADNPQGNKRGYYINQLNSPTKPIVKFVDNYFKGQRNARALRAFFNNQLGLPYAAAGDKFTVELLDKCRGTHELGGLPAGPVYVGVDQGTVLHVSSCFLSGGSRVKWRMLIFSGQNKWDKLDRWLASLGSFVCVIDAHPEKTAAADLSIRYPGRVWVGFEKDRPNQAEMADFDEPKYDKEADEVNIDRTMAFDSVIASYLNGQVILSRDARDIGEHMPKLPYNGFYYQMTQQARVEEEDAKGRIVAFWKKNKNPDHWHHADMFEFVATLRTPHLIVPTGIGDLFQRSGNVIARS
jgi:Phage terminase large subunit (GpA)